MNIYEKFKKEQEEKFNQLPIGFAFSKAQFNAMLDSWGIKPSKAKEKITSIGAGGYIQNEDLPKLVKVLQGSEKELLAEIASDSDGSGFIKDMFDYELANHEYGYTENLDDVIDACGLTMEKINSTPALKNGLTLALERYNE